MCQPAVASRATLLFDIKISYIMSEIKKGNLKRFTVLYLQSVHQVYTYPPRSLQFHLSPHFPWDTFPRSNFRSHSYLRIRLLLFPYRSHGDRSDGNKSHPHQKPQIPQENTHSSVRLSERYLPDPAPEYRSHSVHHLHTVQILLLPDPGFRHPRKTNQNMPEPSAASAKEAVSG